MIKFNTDVAIFSVYKSAYNEDVNKANHEDVVKLFDNMNIKYKVVEGVYLGEKELSFVVPLVHGIRLVVDNITKKYEQECWLHLNQYREAKLVYDGCEAYKGRFKEVSEDIAKRETSYTHDTNDDKYYIIEGV